MFEREIEEDNDVNFSILATIVLAAGGIAGLFHLIPICVDTYAWWHIPWALTAVVGSVFVAAGIVAGIIAGITYLCKKYLENN